MIQRSVIGSRVRRTDGREKVTGAAEYAVDVMPEGTLWCRFLRSPLPHARVSRIDVGAARSLPGVHAILTGSDVEGLRHGNMFVDEPLLASWDRLRFIGDKVAVVAADDADIAERAAHVARSLGFEPRVAFVSFSTFGYPVSERAEKMHVASDVLDRREVDFEYDGEMTADVALNADVLAQYPFCRLSGPANVLVVPARHSASISVKLLQEMGGATVIGPILAGIEKPVQLCATTSTETDILHMAVMAACKVA